jgi:O-antigen/teichoic acid export membrane protein
MPAVGQGEAGSSEARSYGRRASLLSIGVGLTGLITYLYFALASHELSREDYGEIAVLWSAVFITVSTLQRPVEQLLSRSISEHMAAGRSYSHPVRVAAGIQGEIAVAFVSVAVALREPITDGLLHGNTTLFWIGVAAVAAYGASYFARGFLAGQRSFGLFTALILSESVFRTLFAVLVAVSVLSGQSWVAVGIVAAPSLSLMVVPFAFLRRAKKAGAQKPAGGGGEAPQMSMKQGSGFAAAVLVIMFSEQAFLNAGPIIVRALDDAAAAGFIFNVLMLARAPLQLFQAVSTSILPHLTNLHTSTAPESEREFHRSVRGVLLGIAGFAAFTSLVVLIAGPQLMQIAFSDKYEYDRLGLLLVAVGRGLYLGSVTLNQACLAQGQVRRAAARWIGCAAFFIAWNFLPIVGDEFRRVEIGFLLTAGILFALLFVVYRRPHERAEDVPTAGSAEELEARLASIDENV